MLKVFKGRSPMTLKIELENSGESSIWRLSGQIVLGKEATLLQESVMAHPNAQMVLDLDAISAVDAGGLGTLVFLHEWARAVAGEFKLMNVPRHMRELLALTNLDRVLEVLHPAEVYALSAACPYA
jgi:anti-anti-sigma factor